MSSDQSFLDSLTTIDDKLGELIQVTKQVSRSVGGTERRSIGIREKRTKDLSKLVPGDDEVTRTQQVPFDGWVDGFTVGWPSGASRLVGVRLEDNETGEKYFPEGSDQFAAMDDFTETFPTSFKVDENDELTVVFKSDKSPSVDVPINALVSFKRSFPWED